MDLIQGILAADDERKQIEDLRNRQSLFAQGRLPEDIEIESWLRKAIDEEKRRRALDMNALFNAYARNQTLGSTEYKSKFDDLSGGYGREETGIRDQYSRQKEALKKALFGEGESLSRMENVSALRPIQEKTSDLMAGNKFPEAQGYVGGVPSYGNKYLDAFKQKMLPRLADIVNGLKGYRAGM